jgi:hypothetical protein
MAPVDAANALQSNRPRPSTRRSIVPAIPLPYIQKRKQQGVVPKKTEEIPASSQAIESPSTNSPPGLVTIPIITNGSTEVTPSSELDEGNAPVTSATSVTLAAEDISDTQLAAEQGDVAAPAVAGELTVIDGKFSNP